MAGHILKSFQFYGYAVIQIMIEPRQFFAELSNNAKLVKSLGFCLICSIFYIAASLLTSTYPNSFMMGGISFFNSVGMVFVSSALSYMIMVLILGKRAGFEIIFSVYAFSSGVTLLLSWMSFFFWITEPWKWWLIYTGFKNSCGMSWKSAAFIILFPIVIQLFLLHSLYPVFFK